MLIPILGEICCTKNILRYISKNISDKTVSVFLLLTVLILSNTICFLFPYKTAKDFENLIMNNWTYSIRTHQDKMIISGDEELIIMYNYGRNDHIKNDKFVLVESFIIDDIRGKIYLCNFDDDKLIILDMKTFDITDKIYITNRKFEPTRLCCNNDFSKLMIIFESLNTGYLINLDKPHDIKLINKISTPRDSLIYNKYRNCFLVSFHEKNNFLQEIDIENKKTRKIKSDKGQGYLAISERNKEIYVAFHQQGKIGVYDAETMKLKRKIKSNYSVKDITYDEELNILIAPSYFTGYVDIFLMDGSDKLLTREFVGYNLREGCFDPKKENLYICSESGLYKKELNIKKLIEENIK